MTHRLVIILMGDGKRLFSVPPQHPVSYFSIPCWDLLWTSYKLREPHGGTWQNFNQVVEFQIRTKIVFFPLEIIDMRVECEVRGRASYAIDPYEDAIWARLRDEPKERLRTRHGLDWGGGGQCCVRRSDQRMWVGHQYWWYMHEAYCILSILTPSAFLVSFSHYFWQTDEEKWIMSNWLYKIKKHASVSADFGEHKSVR